MQIIFHLFLNYKRFTQALRWAAFNYYVENPSAWWLNEGRTTFSIT